MKKKIILITILIVILIITISVLCGCKTIEDTAQIDRIEKAGYEVIECNHIDSANPTIYIEMYDPETKVIYGYFRNGYGTTIFPILNSDGTPKLYKEDKSK